MKLTAPQQRASDEARAAWEAERKEIQARMVDDELAAWWQRNEALDEVTEAYRERKAQIKVAAEAARSEAIADYQAALQRIRESGGTAAPLPETTEKR